MNQYQKRKGNPVTAVQINLELDNGGIAYRKWGDKQWAKQGDWFVDNSGEVYTIDAESFAKTYKITSVPGQYVKTGKVWAERAEDNGVIQTKEGQSHYSKGNWLVYNEPGRRDGYVVSHDRFAEMYELVTV